MGKTAIILGATGLTGSFVLSMLVENKEYSKIIILSRKPIPVAGERVKLILTDFSDVASISQYIRGDEVFCCLGTTIKKARSVDNFIKIDFDLPYKIAVEAQRNGAGAFHLMSSIGANSKSRNYYLRTKGRLEEAIISLKFDRTVILRPSLLLGKRKENRFGEEIARFIFPSIDWLFWGPLAQYRAIKSKTVAEAMIATTQLGPGLHILDSAKIKSLINKSGNAKKSRTS
jgi:uncharacterized protein YbjT (DUF2867 family)